MKLTVIRLFEICAEQQIPKDATITTFDGRDSGLVIETADKEWWISDDTSEWEVKEK